jgi:putative ABC transport system permease protein
MKMLPFIFQHLRHNWVRTASTVLAMAASIFLFCTLETFVAGLSYGLKSAKDSRLITRHNVSLAFPIPQAYKERIASIPEVSRVATSNWFGGYYQDRKNFFPNFAVDMEEYLEMYPEYILSDAARSALMQDLRACVIGAGTAKKFDWHVGSVFQLESFIPSYRKNEPFEFTVAGIYETDDVKFPGTSDSVMLFHYKYLYEGTGQKAGAGTYIMEIKDPSKAVQVSKAVDDLFENSDTPTKTETEGAFRAGFISMGGNLALLLHTIGLAVTFTILLVTANTMSMAIRERRTEIGVLKTLGFSNGRVLGMILTEGVILGAAGGLLGIALAEEMIKALPKLPFIGDAVRFFPRIGLSPEVGAAGLGLALLIGLAAGKVPALISYRAKITDLLRHV